LNAKRLKPRRRRKLLSARKSKKAKQGDNAAKPIPKLPPPPYPPLKESVPLTKDVYNKIYANIRARARCR